MAFLKFIFLLLIAFPFAIFLLFVLDKLMDELKNTRTGKRNNVPPVKSESTGRKRKRRKERQKKKKAETDYESGNRL